MSKNQERKHFKLLGTILIAFSLILLMPTTIFSLPASISLGKASTFGVLAGTSITNTGPTIVDGTAGANIGLHPGSDPTIESFPGQDDITLSGQVYLFDEVAQEAQNDLLVAYNDVSTRAFDETIAADLEGRTLKTGVYRSESSIMLTGTLILDGENNPNAVFILQAGSSLTTMANSKIVLINGAQACNVYWAVGSSVTLGTNSTFVGSVLASESITATTGAEIFGQLLALNGAVTLDENTITNDACLAAGSLKVTKNVVGEVGVDQPSIFSITITGPNNYTDTQLIESGSSYTWSNLETGMYVVTEETLPSTWGVTGTGEYHVHLGQVTDVVITNTYTAGEGEEELPQTGVLGLPLEFILLGLGIVLARKWK